MSIKTLTVKIIGNIPLLLNNPRCVDSQDFYARKISAITKKRAKTDEDFVKLRDLEIRSKIYWDDNLKIVIPSTWLTSSVHNRSFKLQKISKADSRSGLFATTSYIKLFYDKHESIDSPEDFVLNHYFRHSKILKQGQVRICKHMPILHDWEFTTDLDFDDTIYDFDVVKSLLLNSANYGGFGDFRPTFGRATAIINLNE